MPSRKSPREYFECTGAHFYGLIIASGQCYTVDEARKPDFVTRLALFWIFSFKTYRIHIISYRSKEYEENEEEILDLISSSCRSRLHFVYHLAA